MEGRHLEDADDFMEIFTAEYYDRNDSLCFL